jgi:hypothetical protein
VANTKSEQIQQPTPPPEGQLFSTTGRLLIPKINPPSKINTSRNVENRKYTPTSTGPTKSSYTSELSKTSTIDPLQKSALQSEMSSDEASTVSRTVVRPKKDNKAIPRELVSTQHLEEPSRIDRTGVLKWKDFIEIRYAVVTEGIEDEAGDPVKANTVLQILNTNNKRKTVQGMIIAGMAPSLRIIKICAEMMLPKNVYISVRSCKEVGMKPGQLHECVGYHGEYYKLKRLFVTKDGYDGETIKVKYGGWYILPIKPSLEDQDRITYDNKYAWYHDAEAVIVDIRYAYMAAYDNYPTKENENIWEIMAYKKDNLDGKSRYTNESRTFKYEDMYFPRALFVAMKSHQENSTNIPKGLF